jgi:REP element-mobilizing transposase RayT
MIQMITRRTLRRTHLFRPDLRFNQLCLYLLAVYSERYNIDIHAIVVMSTHEHLIVTDREGRIPDFLRDYHRELAMATKTLRRWDGAVWDDAPTSRVELCTPQAVVEKLAYIMANPVDAALVKRAGDWPGVNTLPHQLGTQTWTVKRPDFYFDPDNPQWPETATLGLAIPLTPWSLQELQRRVALELTGIESEALRRVHAKGSRVLGRSCVLQGSPYDQVKRREPLRCLNPQIAVGRGQRHAFIQAVRVLRMFRQAYRIALAEWQSGCRNVTFPPATWQMCWLHRAEVAPG